MRVETETDGGRGFCCRYPWQRNARGSETGRKGGRDSHAGNCALYSSSPATRACDSYFCSREPPSCFLLQLVLELSGRHGGTDANAASSTGGCGAIAFTATGAGHCYAVAQAAWDEARIWNIALLLRHLLFGCVVSVQQMHEEHAAPGGFHRSVLRNASAYPIYRQRFSIAHSPGYCAYLLNVYLR